MGGKSNSVFTRHEKLAILDHQNWRCLYCRKKLNPSNLGSRLIQFDHFIPQSLGGESSKSNMMNATCDTCNSIKTNHIFHTIEDARLYIRGRLGLSPYDECDLNTLVVDLMDCEQETRSNQRRIDKERAEQMLKDIFGH